MHTIAYEHEGSWVPETDPEILKTIILQHLATTFSEDQAFLKKVNKLTFGLTVQ